MADRIMFIGWGHPVRGREELALEAFDEAVALYGRLQQEGRIESFDVVLLEPQSELRGYMQLHGTPEQVVAVHDDPDFRRVIVKADLVVDRLSIYDGDTNAAIPARLEVYREAVAQVPQHA